MGNSVFQKHTVLEGEPVPELKIGLFLDSYRL